MIDDLTSQPVFGVAITLVFYSLTHLATRRSRWALANPLLLGSLGIILLLVLLRIDYQEYNRGGSLVSFWLGPATVALAVPLYKQLESVKRNALPILAGIAVGSLVGMISAAGIAALFGAEDAVVRSLLPKSVTTPIAIELARVLGGIPSLTSVLVVTTGLIGNTLGPFVLRLARVRRPEAVGLALGTAAHGIGTARALQISEESGAMSGLAMGLAGVLTSIYTAVYLL